MSLSLVIPALNEADAIGATLAGVAEGFSEVIVADGGSADSTVEIARGAGARVSVSGPGRGGQQNAGAALASGDVLVFLHADTRLPADAPERIRAALADPAVVGGGFSLAIDSDDPFLRIVARTATWRARSGGLFYGDQALFVRRDVFEKLGGFPLIPIMEDVALVRALRRVGRLALVEAPVLTSARRWEKENPLYTTLRNWVLVSAYLLGVPPHRLARWYRPHKD